MSNLCARRPQWLTLTVVDLKGEEVLHKVEVTADEKVGVLITKIENAVGSGKRVQLFANGCELHATVSLKTSGLEDGDTVSALLTPKVEPQSWRTVAEMPLLS